MVSGGDGRAASVAPTVQPVRKLTICKLRMADNHHPQTGRFAHLNRNT
ncbi:hypothetical protein J2S34_000097 [Nitrobacter winogradskyi]|uniref:Uncharacterized protein n=1 Tax=Nitrobacter winogradskyi TaxID=913 RepID=A0ACC6AFN9_NITWI|nr:hypothetical protein [Nitrobacter winogradskyi]